MRLVDTHCHLDSKYYPDGCDAALGRAAEAGVAGFVAIGVGDTLGPAREALAIATRRPEVWAAVGVHPHDARVLDDALFTELAALARSPRVVAFGEIGLDYHYMHSPKETQLSAFRRLIGLARELRLPIVVHTREAAEDTLDLLETEGAREVGGIIHCFSEDVAFARRALDLGFDLSFSGIVTFKRSVAIQEAAVFAPIERVLVETDSPYLAPVPFRGKPCEPAHIVHTARKIAELRGVPLEELAARTTENATRRLGVEA